VSGRVGRMSVKFLEFVFQPRIFGRQCRIRFAQTEIFFRLRHAIQNAPDKIIGSACQPRSVVTVVGSDENDAYYLQQNKDNSRPKSIDKLKQPKHFNVSLVYEQNNTAALWQA